MEADDTNGDDLDLRLDWPEDTGQKRSVRAQPSDRSGAAVLGLETSETGMDPRRQEASGQTADSAAAWLPAIDARLGELGARLGRLEATGQTLSRLESGFAELADRVSVLGEVIEERLGHLDDRMEYVALAGAMPGSTGGDGGEFGHRLVQVSEQLDKLTNEVAALRRRIALRARSNRPPE